MKPNGVLMVIMSLLCSIFLCCGQAAPGNTPKTETMTNETKQNEQAEQSEQSDGKMKVEIWSDVMCPFCYIGKRNFESAMQQFADSAHIEVEWKSFQLDPNIPVQTVPTNVYAYLARRKGISYEESVKMHERVVAMAKNAGLQYNFDKAVIANSFNAHRLIQLAKTKNLGAQAEERLFYAYFTEGKDMGNVTVLKELGKDIGLTEAEVNTALTDNRYADKVNTDISEARRVGATGVPFFVFDRKYSVSGAQPPAVLLQTLQKSFGEWKKENVEPVKE